MMSISEIWTEAKVPSLVSMNSTRAAFFWAIVLILSCSSLLSSQSKILRFCMSLFLLKLFTTMPTSCSNIHLNEIYNRTIYYNKYSYRCNTLYMHGTKIYMLWREKMQRRVGTCATVFPLAPAICLSTSHVITGFGLPKLTWPPRGE